MSQGLKEAQILEGEQTAPLTLLVGKMTDCHAPGSCGLADGGGEHELNDDSVEV